MRASLPPAAFAAALLALGAAGARADDAQAPERPRIRATHRVDVIGPGERIETVVDRLRMDRAGPRSGAESRPAGAAPQGTVGAGGRGASQGASPAPASSGPSTPATAPSRPEGHDRAGGDHPSLERPEAEGAPAAPVSPPPRPGRRG